MSTLLPVSIALLAGLLMTRIFKPLKLPSVTAYLIAGILVGSYGLGALRIDGLGFNSMEELHNLSLISDVALVSIFVNPFSEIVASLILGSIMGWFLTKLEKLFNSNTNCLNMTIAFVLLTVSLAMMEFDLGTVHIEFSSLLVCMMLGTIFCNLCPLSHDLMDATDKWTSPLFAIFL